MDNGRRRPSKPLASPQKFRPGAPVKKKAGALSDPLLLSPDVLDDATRRELLHDVLRPRRASPATTEPPSASPAGPTPGAGTQATKDHFADQLRARVRSGSQNSDDLVSAMAGRLKDLEQRHRSYQSELQELHTKYRQLNDRYQSERQLREEAETAVLTLYEEKEALEQQLRRAQDDGSDDGGAAGGQRQSHAGAAKRTPPSPSPHKQEGDKEEAAFDLFSGDFDALGEDSNARGDDVTPTHFINSARPGTVLYSPQKGATHEAKVGRDGGAAAHAGPSPMQQRGRGSPRRGSSAHVDVALLQKNARILSDYVGWKGVVKNGRQAGIRERDVVRVVIYKNGICVNRGPFRPYGWALCDAFLDDLTEGYYPYEFKDRYPDGFPIEITDCSAEACEVDQNGAARARLKVVKAPPAAAGVGSGGEGRRLGGAPLLPGQPRPIHTLQDAKSDQGYHAVSAAEFISKIPAQRVTAGGQLVAVRDDVAALMGVKAAAGEPPQTHAGPSDSVKRAAAAEAASHRARQQAQSTQRPEAAPRKSSTADEGRSDVTVTSSSPQPVAGQLSILIRLPDGHRVVLHVLPEATVQDLRRAFIKAAPQFAQSAYELYQAFPVKCSLDTYARTLASYGVRTSCALMLRIK